jgi:hypothetical protein
MDEALALGIVLLSPRLVTLAVAMRDAADRRRRRRLLAPVDRESGCGVR